MSNRRKPKMFRGKKGKDARTQVLESALAKNITIPDDEVKVIKEVPAMVEGTEVGIAYIHDDGSVAIKYNEDAPQWALDKIKATEAEVGYSLETGGPSGPA